MKCTAPIRSFANDAASTRALDPVQRGSIADPHMKPPDHDSGPPRASAGHRPRPSGLAPNPERCIFSTQKPKRRSKPKNRLHSFAGGRTGWLAAHSAQESVELSSQPAGIGLGARADRKRASKPIGGIMGSSIASLLVPAALVLGQP